MDNTATAPFVTKDETYVSIKNVRLDDRAALLADEITVVNKVTLSVNEKTGKPDRVVSKQEISTSVKEISFPFRTITVEELKEIRKSHTPSFVLKENDTYYYTVIPTNISFVSSTLFGTHKCASAGKECQHLSAASDEEGGCAKVRERSSCIERYPWIVVGYETFNTGHDSFIVIICQHYEQCLPRSKVSSERFRAAKLGLAQFVWPDVTNQAEVRKRVEKNHNKYNPIY